jgi:hypothetical protein
MNHDVGIIEPPVWNIETSIWGYMEYFKEFMACWILFDTIIYYLKNGSTFKHFLPFVSALLPFGHGHPRRAAEAIVQVVINGIWFKEIFQQ